MTPRLLSGPAPAAGPESLAAHRARFGALPGRADRSALIPMLGAAGLLGRGGAGFPVSRKWASVAERGNGDAIVLANGAEGEPLSAKDRVLMAARPHLVLDGAELAADSVGARRIVLYVGGEHGHAIAALDRAMEERRAVRVPGLSPIPMELVTPPRSYVAGEESAAVHYVNAGDPRPTSTPPRPFERGIDGRPTLVQNVESLAHAALIARFGDHWYREAGRGETRGTALVTIGNAPRSGVVEVEVGSTLAEIAGVAGVQMTGGPVLVGGYFGGWVAGVDAWRAPLDPVELKRAGRAFGCGVVSFLDERTCGVRVTAQILDFMAGSSAAQCGPCVFGLRAIADASARLAYGHARDDDLRRLAGWSETLAGRGACRHPDGAVGLVRSALRVFDAEFARHQRNRRCMTSERGSSAA
jgi:NADH:ubiquinone oxidoreductase subunit F (NADH-binding)